MAEVAAISTRFEIIRLLGEGGMGVVYEAWDRERESRLALKTLRRFTPEGLARFKREFRALEALHHRNLVHLGELISERGLWFFTMELVDGVDFLRYVRPWQRDLFGESFPASGRVAAARRTNTDTAPVGIGPSVSESSVKPPSDREIPSFDEGRLREALSELADGLIALHGANCVHRDIKPSNIRVTPEGRVVLLDFGIIGEMERDFSVSAEGVAGTPAYMAPEQALSATAAPAADWYSVGVVLYEALTGRLPFDGAPLLVLKQKQMATPTLPSSFVRDLPRDLEQLCFDLLQSEPELRPVGHDVLRRLGRAASSGRFLPSSSSSEPPSSPLVGRQAELRELRDAFDRFEGETVAMIVYGESGIGKTMLVREFAASLASERRDVMLLRGRCHEREDVPYKALDGVIDALGRRLARLTDSTVAALTPVHVGALMRLFPVLRRVNALARDATARASADSLEPRELRRRAFVALRELFARIGRDRRVVVLVDDLHWADADSLALLGDLFRPPDAPPLFFAATARTVTDPTGAKGPQGALVSAIPGEVRLLHLGRLPEVDAMSLASRLMETVGAHDEALAAEIAAEAAGHPLFIDEMARHVAGGEAMGALKLDEALWARASRLNEEARRLLEVTAVLGSPTSQRVAADAASLAPSEFFSNVSALRAGHLVRTSGTHRDDTIEPYHDRVRESVMLHLSEARRRQHHHQIALAFERAGSVDADALAIHWHEAGDISRAAGYSIRAADQAAASLAFDRAARLYRLAAELRPLEARALNLKLADALTNAGRFADAAKVRIALAADAEPTEALDLRRRAAEQLMCCGRFEEGAALLRQTLASLSIRFVDSRFVLLMALVFFRVLVRIRGVKFRRESNRLDRRAIVRIDALRSASLSFSMTDIVRGAYFQTRNLLLALRAGDPMRIVHALSVEACHASYAGHARYTQRLLHAAESVARAVGTDEANALATTAAGCARFFVYDWEGARERLARAESLFQRCVGMTFQLNSARTLLYQALLFLGDLAELRARALPVLREAEELGDRFSTINLRTILAHVGLAADEADRVGQQLDETEQWLARGVFHQQHFFCIVAQAQLALYQRDPIRARSRVQGMWPAFGHSMLFRVPTIRIFMTYLRARITIAAARAAGAPSKEAIRDAEHDSRQLEGEHAAFADGYAAMIHGAIAALQGDDTTARARVAVSGSILAGANMRLEAAAARYREGELLGGDQGAAVVRDATQVMSSQGIVNVNKFVAMMAPGFRD